MEQLDRIQQMENKMDRAEAALSQLREALENYQAVEQELHILEDYCGNGLWQKDFEDDNSGKIPADLKRGVLSEDGLWNVLTDWSEALSIMREITEKNTAAEE